MLFHTTEPVSHPVHIHFPHPQKWKMNNNITFGYRELLVLHYS